MTLQLGIDTGGTYTDAVVLREQSQVVCKAKALTTHHQLIDGLREALNSVLIDIDPGEINLISLSTTLATNALVEGKGRRVGVMLVGYNENQMSRAGLDGALAGDPLCFVAGGHRADGEEAQPLDLAAARGFVESVNDHVDAFAISAMFAVRNPAHELALFDAIVKMTEKPVSLGHQLSSALDAPRRALTCLLNARLIPSIRSLLDAAMTLLAERDIQAPLMVVKGDGSLVLAETAAQAPVETILSGPAASVVGAQFLLTESNLVVSDMGGTTTDIAWLNAGEPHLATEGAVVGGWRTMVKAVDIHTFGLGGDSRVVFNRERRHFELAATRVVPLSLLAMQHECIVDELEMQLEAPFGTTFDGLFAERLAAHPGKLSLQQEELWDLLITGPQALKSLFKHQTLERALGALTARGVIALSGFTPSDASHVLEVQSDWNLRAAELGAQLAMRYSAENLGDRYQDSAAFAAHIHERVAEKTARVLLDSAASMIFPATRGQRQASGNRAFSESQQRLLDQTFADHTSPMRLSAHLDRPIAGLGAPASTYYDRAATLLGTTALLPEHADVANAIGAVVGSVRKQHEIVITPAGGECVRVHFVEGPVEFDDLARAIAVAEPRLKSWVQKHAADAGAIDVSVAIERFDKIVEQQGSSVFFECRLVGTATGRPQLA